MDSLTIKGAPPLQYGYLCPSRNSQVTIKFSQKDTALKCCNVSLYEYMDANVEAWLFSWDIIENMNKINWYTFLAQEGVYVYSREYN